MKYVKVEVTKTLYSYVVISVPDEIPDTLDTELQIYKKAVKLANELDDCDWNDEDIDANYGFQVLNSDDPDIIIAEDL